MEDAMLERHKKSCDRTNRRDFIGGSDARIIMGQDEKALIRLWQEKRGEVGPEDLSTNLIVQLGLVTEDLNRQWYERNTGNAIKDIQCRVRHPVIRWMAATLDGVVAGTGAVYEAKFMLPWSFSEEFAAEKYMAQLQHNMWVTNARMAALSIITGGGKWVEISIAADQLYQHLLLTAEKKFWRCVSFGEPPRLFGVESPRPRIEEHRDLFAPKAPMTCRLQHRRRDGSAPSWPLAGRSTASTSWAWSPIRPAMLPARSPMRQMTSRPGGSGERHRIPARFLRRCLPVRLAWWPLRSPSHSSTYR
jgi:putative phage-type endonuclease